jgi:hypothetical protein
MDKLRKHGIWLALIATLGATFWASSAQENPKAGEAGSTGDVVPVSRARPSAPSLDHAGIELDIARLRRAELGKPTRNLFGSEAAAKPADAERDAPPVLERPVIPFVYAGKLQDEGGYIVFLTAGDKNHSVREGDLVDEWQVRSIKPPQIVMHNLPMKQDVTMMIGEVN